MFNKELVKRIKILESQVKRLADDEVTLSVPISDADGKLVKNSMYGRSRYGHFTMDWEPYKRKELSFKQVCDALQEMCNIQITFQEVAGTSGVVIYEKDND